jgi:uncharacterized integral membrane protein
MNKVKTVFWVIIFGLIMLVFFQNQEFFMAKQSIKLNLLFKIFQSPEVPNAVLFLAFFLAGLLIAYFFGLAERFKLKKTIKNLNTKIASQPQELPSTDTEAEAITSALSDTNQSSDNRVN